MGGVAGSWEGDGRGRQVILELYPMLFMDEVANAIRLDDLRLLRHLGLIVSGGRGVGAKWWLFQPGEP